MPTPHGKHRHLLQQVVSRATWDLAFRKHLLSDTKAAIRDAFGITVPADYRLRFIERPSDLDALVVLPDLHEPGEELDDDDLDKVAGGGDTDGSPW